MFFLLAGGCTGDKGSPAPSTGTPDAEPSASGTTALGKQEPPSPSANLKSSGEDNADPIVGESLLGRTFYVTQSGTGRQDGSDWQNALASASLQELLSADISPGDQVILGSGKYPKFSVTRGGTADQPVTITGTDTGEGNPAIQGGWKETNPKYHAHSWSGVSLAKGASYLRIGGLDISGFIYGIKANNVHHVELSRFSITRCREAVSISGVTDSAIRDCRFTHYTKRGIGFEEGCHDLVISDVVADATGGSEGWPTEAFPFGFAIEDDEGNHSIRYERCTARNNFFAGEPGQYWNGDGFLAESNSENISYMDCVAVGNTDGGWDDKSRAPRLVGCVAARNKRGFRLWNVRGDREHPARLENCLGVYNKSAGGSGSSAGLWTCGAVVAERCTFHNNATAAVVIENNRPGGKLRAVDCILSVDAATDNKPLVLKEGEAMYEPEGVVMWNGKNPDDDPRYRAPSAQWDGDPLDAFNSQRHGEAKGFRAEHAR